MNDFFKWVNFFTGCTVTVGNGRTEWKVLSGCWENDNSRGRVKLGRTHQHRHQTEDVTTTVNFDRVRIVS
jgi:hypothetical protein